jgi:hypothetical protein
MFGANGILLHSFRFQMSQAQNSASALGEFFQTRQISTSGLMTIKKRNLHRTLYQIYALLNVAAGFYMKYLH